MKKKTELPDLFISINRTIINTAMWMFKKKRLYLTGNYSWNSDRC